MLLNGEFIIQGGVYSEQQADQGSPTSQGKERVEAQGSYWTHGKSKMEPAIITASSQEQLKMIKEELAKKNPTGEPI